VALSIPMGSSPLTLEAANGKSRSFVIRRRVGRR
jgi:hypothetical protein